MKNITHQFNSGFTPFKALLIYRHDQQGTNGQSPAAQVYVESYDIGRDGRPINAHPLSLKETTALHDLLGSTQELKDSYLTSKGLLPNKVLYVDQRANGYAIWYTPPQEVDLFFVDGLGIPSGRFHLPAMLWKADAENLTVYVFKGKAKPNEDTKLCHAPFLNIYTNGQVCMGTVRIDLHKAISLEQFISMWETNFFNSEFSHSISGNNNTRSNTTELWRDLAGSGRSFPQAELISTNITLKQLIR